MDRVLALSIGEIILKGKNRSYFEKNLINQIKRNLDGFQYGRIYKNQGKIYIEVNEKDYKGIIRRLEKIFGLVYISPSIRVNKKLDEIEEAVKTLIKEKLTSNEIKSFKVVTNRVDKSFDLKSPEISRLFGGFVLKNFPTLKVDVHNPDMYVYIDIREKAYIYIDRYKGSGGMPAASNGQGMVLLSGGIDSPVAAYMMARRGVKISAVHYHSYPFTNQRAEDKVKTLAKILSRYMGEITLYSVNILEIQKNINKYCPKEEMTILSRRFMMKIAEKIAKNKKIPSLITGENLGQVASQTLEGITVTNAAVELPIFRPLIGFDKVDIIDIAKDIETYETSILPYEDCCTVFLPKNPVIKPRLTNILRSEAKLDIEKLIDDAIGNMDIYKIGGSDEK